MGRKRRPMAEDERRESACTKDAYRQSRNTNIYRWAGKVLSALFQFEFPESPRAELEMVSASG